ncbi:MAG: tetratricopeptide repeat protein, partial [candidate division KSB1 bacterium]
AKRAIVTTVETSVPQADLEGLYAEAYKAFLYSDFKTAAGYYKRYLDKKVEDDQVWAMMGAALLRSGAPERAAEAFEQACKLKPAKGLYFKQLGITYDLMDRVEASTQALAQAHELGKADSVTLAVWGKNLVKLNQLTEALTHLERAAKLNRANLLAHYYLAVALMRLGQTDRATAHFEAVTGAKVNTPLKTEAQAQFRKLRG